VLELDLHLTAEQVLEECRRRGVFVRNERELARRAGSHHWHLRMPGRSGTLELNEWQNRVWVKVHPLRDGGWARALARELSEQRRKQARKLVLRRNAARADAHQSLSRADGAAALVAGDLSGGDLPER
jgi:hypothetical protein